MPNLPTMLQRYVDHLAAAGQPLTFSEIVNVTPRYNGFRCLKKRGLIRPVGRSRYVLTAVGLAAVSGGAMVLYENMLKERLAATRAEGAFLAASGFGYAGSTYGASLWKMNRNGRTFLVGREQALAMAEADVENVKELPETKARAT